MGSKMQKLKYFVLIMSSITMFKLSYADNLLKPYVNLDSNFWIVIGKPESVQVTNDFLQKLLVQSYKFDNYLNISFNNIKQDFQFNRRFEDYKEIKYKNYKIRIYTAPYGTKDLGIFKDKGIYVFNNQDICIGYSSVIKGKKIGYLKDNPTFIKLRSLEKTGNYLGKKLLVPKSVITFHKYKKGDYIERYGLNDSFIFLDGFYPKKLDKFVSSIVLDTLNFNYTAKYRVNKYKNMTDEQFELELAKIGKEEIKIKNNEKEDKNDDDDFENEDD